MKGWIAFHRKTLESVVWTDPVLFRLWMLCLTKAAHKDNPNFIFDGTPTPLKKGQFITGRKSLTEEYNQGLKAANKISESKTFRFLKKLKSNNMLNIESTTKYSVITIINWDKYQSTEHQNEQQVNNERTTSEQRLNTNNNENNNNNVNNVLGTKRNKNNKYTNAYETYSQAYPAKPMNQFIAQSIAAWINDFGGQEDIVSYAIEQAGKNAASTPKYFEKILKSWELQNVKSLDDAIRITEDFETKRDKQLSEQIQRQEAEQRVEERAQQPLPNITLHNWLNPEDS